MKGLVLSAGYGERLRPLTETTPKPILEVGGRPLIHYPLLMLKRAGITEVAINVHHLAAEVQRAIGDGAALGLRITYSPERVLAGTGGPLAVLRDYFGDEPFVLLNCDTILDLDLAATIRFHRERAGMATFVLRAGGDPDAYSRIECADDGRIRRMRLLRGRTRGLHRLSQRPRRQRRGDADALHVLRRDGLRAAGLRDDAGGAALFADGRSVRADRRARSAAVRLRPSRVFPHG
jgi:NDP-sugar pyrophosphorylase family protein